MHTIDNIYNKCIPLQMAVPEDGLYGPKHEGGIYYEITNSYL
jgi:hypothetical protein